MSIFAVFVLSFVLVLVLVGVMTIGLWFGRKPISGTCGGLANMQQQSCSICGGNPQACESQTPAEKKV